MTDHDFKKFADLCGFETRLHPEYGYAQMRAERRQRWQSAKSQFTLGKDAVIDALERFCKRTGWKRADIKFRSDIPPQIQYYVELFMPSSEVQTTAATLNEAIVRAVLNAAEKQS